MFERVKELIANSKILQFTITFVIGVGVGALFYPTKHIEEKLTKTHQEEINKLDEQHEQSLNKAVELYNSMAKDFRDYKSESEKKISSLTTQVSTLKSKQKTSYFKVVRPDGTIEIKKFTESEVDESTKVIAQVQEEFKQKVDSIEQKWAAVHKSRVQTIQKEFDSKEQEYKKTIDTLQQSKVVDINKKNFSLEVGAMTNRNYYGHVTYDIFGPILIGLQSELGPAPSAGAGLGLRF